jgi:hypothetical protein
MNTQEKLFAELNIELSDDLSDCFNSGHDEISDYCHERADGDENVIYYSRARELYNSASIAERDEAEGTVEDCGGFGEGANMDNRFTALAYWITYNRLSSALRDEAESLIEELEEKNEDRAIRQVWGEVIEETVAVLESI